MIAEHTIKHTVTTLAHQEKNHASVIIEQCVRVVATRWIASDGTEAGTTDCNNRRQSRLFKNHYHLSV